ncbi:ABC transporter ATP-binding protein [Glaciimonas sp. PAMC28666]|uniref:ABC transporter ATP-binding protein n=1 Tax=Glaciimonas sp. PAMC28666 TaxID=2807626 RepID=UPI001964BB58|nr:ABC transporter ATP-binding protein [Glaciimonas sp. PAMC28666]QRX85002.1 ABC transporter ATP-binding protein [Glaciimonas sp. PAMC28666]
MVETPLLQIRDLRVSFRTDKKNTVEAVKGISFDIARDTTVALVGESGSGKSVSSLAVMGLLSSDSASIAATSSVLFEGRDLLTLSPTERRQLCGKDISMIFQEPMTSLNPVFTVGFQIGEVLQQHMGMNAKAARARAIALLKEVGIPEPETRIDAFPNQLSGGQQQRVMIAIAIACEPKLLIADEPTTALDVTIQKQIIDLIEALRKRHKMSVLFITHDLALVGEIADEVIVMRNGEVREKGTTRQIFENPQDAYTKALLLCRPSLDSRPWRLPVISDYMNGNPEIDHPELTAKQRSRGLTGKEEILLDVRNLGKSFYSRQGLFGRKEFKAVQNVSFTLARGKTLGVVGESGSGKTTVGLTLLRLHQATSGQALFQGKDILAMSNKEFMSYKRRIQIIFQNPYASLNPRFTVGQILLEPMRIHQIGRDDTERVDMALQLLKKVGMPAAAFHRYPHEFSGGQRQRIAIARCLTLRPEVLVCDESVSALDVSVQAQVLNLLQDLQEEFGMSYIFISHDLAVVKYIADQVMVMHQGVVVELANSDELYRNPTNAYTRSLLSAIPRGLPHAFSN